MIKLVRTCDACPEQYDAYIGDELVGYLRLRHGRFTVQCPDYINPVDLVYSAYPRGDGCFYEDERDYHLRFACQAILQWKEQRDLRPPAPDVEYEIVGEADLL